jgi:hypothetical protein
MRKDNWLDISAGMLEVGVKKSQIKPVKTIEMVLGDSENMPSMIIILMRLQSLLERNFETLEKGLRNT